MPQIRLNKSPELNKVLTFLQGKYRLLSEAEIIKAVLSEQYHKEMQAEAAKEQKIKSAYQELKVESKKLGDILLKKRGLKRKSVNEKKFYDFLNA